MKEVLRNVYHNFVTKVSHVRGLAVNIQTAFVACHT